MYSNSNRTLCQLLLTAKLVPKLTVFPEIFYVVVLKSFLTVLKIGEKGRTHN